jgi:hypothetical protein
MGFAVTRAARRAVERRKFMVLVCFWWLEKVSEVG